MERKRAQSLKDLERMEAELLRLDGRLKTSIEEAKQVHRQYEFALEEVREKNHVLEQTVQTLVASHKLLMERVDADVAVEVRRRVGVKE